MNQKHPSTGATQFSQAIRTLQSAANSLQNISVDSLAKAGDHLEQAAECLSSTAGDRLADHSEQLRNPEDLQQLSEARWMVMQLLAQIGLALADLNTASAGKAGMGSSLQVEV